MGGNISNKEISMDADFEANSVKFHSLKTQIETLTKERIELQDENSKLREQVIRAQTENSHLKEDLKVAQSQKDILEMQKDSDEHKRKVLKEEIKHLYRLLYHPNPYNLPVTKK